MSKDSSTKSYQNKKQSLQKKPRKKYRSQFEEEKQKKDNIDANGIQISQKMKNQSLVEYRKTY